MKSGSKMLLLKHCYTHFLMLQFYDSAIIICHHVLPVLMEVWWFWRGAAAATYQSRVLRWTHSAYACKWVYSRPRTLHANCILREKKEHKERTVMNKL